jgi:hypothetical protein
LWELLVETNAITPVAHCVALAASLGGLQSNSGSFGSGFLAPPPGTRAGSCEVWALLGKQNAAPELNTWSLAWDGRGLGWLGRLAGWGLGRRGVAAANFCTYWCSG